MKRLVLILSILFICSIGSFAQEPTIIKQAAQQQIDELQRKNAEQNEMILQMSRDLAQLQKECEQMQQAMQEEKSDLQWQIGIWFTVLAILVSVFGVLFPLVINNEYNKNFKKKILKFSETAQKAINETEKSRLFAKAYAEDDSYKKIRIYTNIIEMDDKEVKAFINRGMSYRKLGKNENALNDYNQAIKIDPNSAVAYRHRGIFKIFMKQYDEAIEDYSKAIQLDESYVKAYKARAKAYKKRNGASDVESAISDYGKAIYLDPQFAEAYYDRGLLREKNNDIDEALDDYRQAILINPKYAAVYNSRAHTYLKKNEFSNAIKDIRMALSIAPGEAKYIDTYGEIYLAMNELNNALQYFSFAILLQESKIRYEHRAKCYDALALRETDAAKKSEYLAKAEIDRNKALELKKKTQKSDDEVVEDDAGDKDREINGKTEIE